MFIKRSFSFPQILLFFLSTLLVFSCKDKEEDNMAPDCNSAVVTCPNTITDAKDGQIYKVIKIGCQCWTTENVNYAEMGVCYDDLEENCDTYGRLYSWEEMLNGQQHIDNEMNLQGVCPAGWHVPSVWEWRTLVDTLGGIQTAAAKMRAADTLWVTANDDGLEASGFDALPAGTSRFSTFSGLGFQAIFISSTKSDNESIWRINLWGSSADVDIKDVGAVGQNFRYSCRCVKD